VRFFASEIIRKHILSLYSKEIPYSCDVKITDYKVNGTQSGKTLIRAVIFVLRNSQRQILIGKSGSAIKQLGMRARKDIEEFIGDDVYLELTVKLKDNWRNNEKDLQKLGY
jgi:GTP-binding protein Era